MHLSRTAIFFAFILVFSSFATVSASGQSAASTTITGTVTDPSAAVIPDAAVEIHNPVSGFSRSVKTDAAGRFSIPNVPFNSYHLTAKKPDFAPYSQDVDVRSSVPVNVPVQMSLQGSNQTVTVEGEAEDLLQTSSTFQTDVNKDLFEKIPLESASSSVSSLVTLATPGVTADSNGLFHGLGDHAENSFSVDGQSITDQQSKNFSNQIPMGSIESMQVISGAPPAEYGDKTSLVINVTTRSGLGVTTPHGDLTTSYGSFGTTNANFDLAYGGKSWGNFISANGLNTGRFLDPPEFNVMHDKGNEENLFDRVDYQLSQADTLHVNLGYTRSWFQNPNSYDNLNLGVTDPNGNLVGPADQRAQIQTYNIAPSWTRLISNRALFTLGAYVRHDGYNYYPSANPYADLSPIQQEGIRQNRTLTNSGIRSDISYAKGIHNFKAGATYQQTFLNELDDLILFTPVAQPPYRFNGHTDVKELSLFVQDVITKNNWTFSLGIRGDIYNGLTAASQAQPRAGISYNIKGTNTVLRVSYARVMETPFNENLVISSRGCNDPVIASLVPCVPAALNPGLRNEFHAGIEQALGRHFVVSGEWITKYTHNGYDFSILGNTPITFPIEWHNSKIPGFAGRASLTDFHGLSAQVVFSSVSARFFPPQVGGLGVTVGQTGTPFRIDHDEKFNQTTHIQYQPWKTGPWLGFNWRFDSGEVAGAVPCFGVSAGNDCPYSTTLGGQPAIDLSGFTADQEFEAGFFCGSVRATPFAPLPSPCPASQFGSNLVQVPAPGRQNPDHNPARIAARSLFDLAIGDDNLFKGDKYKWSAQISVINLANEYALYNFLSTFSGTHYVTPRSITGEIGFHF